jgi:hypothetical protein
MPNSLTDPYATPLPTPLAAPPGAGRMAVLAALFDAHADGRVGSPQERLAAIRSKANRDRFLERMKLLTLKEQGQIYLRLIAGDDPDQLLPDGEADR